jgi:hypothetical protein
MLLPIKSLGASLLLLTMTSFGVPADTFVWKEFRDDFSTKAGGWPSGVNDRGDQFGYADGNYRILIRVRPGQVAAGQIAGIPLSGMSPKKLVVKTDAVQRTGSSDTVFGLSCGPSQNELYVFAINAEGYYFIFLDDAVVGKADLLQSGRSEGHIRGLGENNRLYAECSGGEDEAAFVFGRKRKHRCKGPRS